MVLGWTMGRLCTVVGQEMWKVKQASAMKTTEIIPDFAEARSFSSFQSIVKEKPPSLCKLLYAGAQTTHTMKNGTKDPTVVRTVPLSPSLANFIVIVFQVVHH